MKSNSNMKKFKEKLNNFSFTSKLKICSIISSVLIIAGILIVSIFGFNLGIDFVGGTVLNVKVGSVLEEGNNYSIVSTQVSNIVEKNGFKVGYIQQEGVGDEAAITVRFMDKANLTEAQLEVEIDELKAELESSLTLNSNALDVTVSNGSRIAPSSSKSLIINSILAILIAVILSIVLAVCFMTNPIKDKSIFISLFKFKYFKLHIINSNGLGSNSYNNNFPTRNKKSFRTIRWN